MPTQKIVSEEHVVRFVSSLKICRFPFPLGVWEGLRFVIVALPGLFSYLSFLVRMKELKSLLIKQNYPLQTIEYGIKRAMALDKHILRSVKEKYEEKIIPYVSTHNPKTPKCFEAY